MNTHITQCSVFSDADSKSQVTTLLKSVVERKDNFRKLNIAFFESKEESVLCLRSE